MRVLVADDDERVRRVVTALLADDDGLVIVGHAANGKEAVEQAISLVPDVILLDVKMPVLTGIEAARIIRDEVPTTRMAMLTASDEDEDLYEALKAGANGYLMKDFLFKDLAGAVRVVAQGHGLLLSPEIAHKLVREFQDTRAGSHESNTLTTRELEVLRLVSLGRANHEIADELCLSSHTVKRHVANILAKLHQRSRLDAVMHAIRSGVLSEAP